MISQKFATIWKNSSRVVSPAPVKHVSGKLQDMLSHMNFMAGDRDSLHKIIGPLLITAQCFGLLPVRGVKARSPKTLYFHPWAVRSLYAYILLACIAFVAVLTLIHTARSLRSETFTVLGGFRAATSGAVFYGNACCATVLFLRLAKRWGSLMRQWNDVEFRLDLTSDGHTKANRCRARTLIAVILILATVEHALSIALNLRLTVSNGSDWLQKYCMSSHSFIFTTIEYSTLWGILILIFSHVATFTWNFMDLFIMLMAQALTSRFHQFNDRLMKHQGKLMSRVWWQEAREQYVALAALTHTLDRNIAGITLLSFSNNLYFVCMQLLGSLTYESPADQNIVKTLYFWGSFMFLVGRLGAVIFFASNVHHASREALPVIFACPSPAFCEEAARLQQHMCSGEELALTGMGLFHVTRSFMLAVAGAIATYEVVLLQFNVAVSGASCPVAPQVDAV